MKRRAGFLIGLCLLASIQLASPAALAAARDETRPDEMEVALDLMVARPLGLAMAGVGSVMFVLTVPFSLIGGNVLESADTLVFRPYKEVLVRCLGCRTEGRYRIAKEKKNKERREKKKQEKIAKRQAAAAQKAEEQQAEDQSVATAPAKKRKRRKARGVGY